VTSVSLTFPASHGTATTDNACNYLAIFSVLVFSFLNSLLEVFKRLRWPVARGRAPLSFHSARTVLSRHRASGLWFRSCSVPARREFLSWVCLGVLSLSEGSSGCTIHLESDLVQGAVPSPRKNMRVRKDPISVIKWGQAKTSCELSEVGCGRSG